MFEALALACAPIVVTDGDTIRCGTERVRLLGIDAPELHGCRQGRVCVPGDGQAAKRTLARILNSRVTIERVKQDRYGRTVARVLVNGRDASCAMLEAGQAVYVAKWDEGGRVRRACPGLAR